MYQYIYSFVSDRPDAEEFLKREQNTVTKIRYFHTLVFNYIHKSFIVITADQHLLRKTVYEFVNLVIFFAAVEKISATDK